MKALVPAVQERAGLAFGLRLRLLAGVLAGLRSLRCLARQREQVASGAHYLAVSSSSSSAWGGMMRSKVGK